MRERFRRRPTSSCRQTCVVLQVADEDKLILKAQNTLVNEVIHLTWRRTRMYDRKISFVNVVRDM